MVTRAQLRELGASRRAIEYALCSGRLHSLHRGVYALVPPPALPPLASEHAAVLACGADAMLSHHAAAALWGIRPHPGGRPIDVTVVARERGRRREGIRAHRVRAIHADDIRTHRGIPATAPARTLLDIAPDLSSRELEWAFDQALVLELTSHAGVRAMLERNDGRPSAPRLRELTDPERPTTVTRSKAESRLLALIRRARLPQPEVNVRVGRFEADFYWRREGVILEFDSWTFHRGRAAFERDHERDAEHAALGLLVLRITWRQLLHEPEAVLAMLAAALARRTPSA